MNTSKNEDTATGEGMPEALSKAEQRRISAAQAISREQALGRKQPPVDNDYVAPGAERFTAPATGQSESALVVEVQHLREKLHDMEHAVHAYLSTQTSVGHAKISSWLDKVKARIHASTAPSTPAPETAPPSLSADKPPTE